MAHGDVYRRRAGPVRDDLYALTRRTFERARSVWQRVGNEQQAARLDEELRSLHGSTPR